MESAKPLDQKVADVLDMYSFKHFSPLLARSQGYAKLSGCRFLAHSFAPAIEQMPRQTSSSSSCEKPDGSMEAAKEILQPIATEFAERLRAREPALVEELERAFGLVMAESARNEMIATLQALGLWPPSIKGANEEDCSYEDLSSPLPTIAQRLYNDEMRRHCVAAEQAGGACPSRRRAMTASYLVDFAHVMGIPLPAVPETQQVMLQEFSQRVAEWKDKSQVRTSTLPRYRPTDITVAMATSVFFGPVVAAGLLMAVRARQHRTFQGFAA